MRNIVRIGSAESAVYLTSNENEAWEMISRIDRCVNCNSFTQKDLFSGTCKNPESYPEGGDSFSVGLGDTCECFAAREKKVQYWIDKLVTMALDAGGVNDWQRRFEFHQKNGTDLKFLGLDK